MMICRVSSRGLAGVRRFSFYAGNNAFVEFRDLTQWEQVEAAVTSLGPDLSATHISAAFAQTQKLLPRPPEPFLVALSQRAVAQRHVLDVKTVTVLYRACASLAHFEPEFLTTLADVVQEQRALMDFGSTAKLLYALGYLQKCWNAQTAATTPPFAKLETLIETLVKRLPIHFHSENCGAGSTALLLSGLSDLNYRHPEVLRQLTTHLIQLPLLTPQQLATLISAAARLRLKDGDLVRRFAHGATTPTVLKRFTEAELASVIYSLQRLGCREHMVYAALTKEAAKPRRLGRFTDHGLANILYALSLVESTSVAQLAVFQDAFLGNGRLQTCHARDFSTLLRSLSRRPKSDVPLLNHLAEEATKKRRLEQWTPSDVALYLFCFAQCDYPHATRLEALLISLSSDRLQSLEPHEIANLVYGIGRLGLPLVAPVHGILQRPLSLRSFSLVAIVRLVTGLSLSVPQVAPLNEMCGEEVLAPGRLRLYAPKELAAIAQAFQRMHLTSRRFVEPLEHALLQDDRYLKCSLPDLAGLAFAFGDLSSSDRPIHTKFLSHLLQTEAARKLPTTTLCSLLSLAARLDFKQQDWVQSVAAIVEARLKRDGPGATDVLSVVCCLSEVQYEGELWPGLLRLLQQRLESQSLPLKAQIRLLKTLAGNWRHLRPLALASGISERLLNESNKDEVAGISNTEITDLALALAATKLLRSQVVEALLDVGLQRVTDSSFRVRELTESVAALLELCFQFRISHALSSTAAAHLELIQETLQKDTSFSVAPYLTPSLAINVLLLRATEGTLNVKLFETGLDVLRALETDGVTFSPRDLSHLYLCFLYVRQQGYKPMTNAQRRLLRAAMEALQTEQSRTQPADWSIQLSDAVGPKLKLDCVLRESNLRVDAVNHETQMAGLFLRPGVEIDLTSSVETGETVLKRAILEHHGYEVRSWIVDAEAAALSEIADWLQATFSEIIERSLSS